MLVVEILYGLSITLLGLYGLNSLALIGLYLRHRKDPVSSPPPPDPWPHVTVQLPIYNEVHLVERLLRAVAALDYPDGRLEIQVLDDSTDETGQIAAQTVEQLQQQGLDIVHLTRTDRSDFKAGALAVGLEQAKGELIAIFDADFLPGADFLRQVVPHFADPAVGCIQTRWGHLNRDYSLLTQTQALGIDGHFVVEQTGRSRAGLFLNFNGTAGIWRRACIEDAGGWQADTLTEDLDLSYRAQLGGWQVLYLVDVVAPAELPARISGFKRQQARWAQGSIQTALKLFKPLLRSSQPWYVKLAGLMHMTGYLVHPLMFLVVVLTLPMRFSSSWALGVAPWLMITAIAPPLLYAVAQVAQSEPNYRRLRFLPMLVLLGMGLAVSNTWAVLKAVLGIRQEFQRTPKFALRGAEDTWLGSAYALGRDPFLWGEIALTLYSLVLILLPGTPWGFVPWLLLYGGGFGYMAGVSLYQSAQRQRWRAKQPTPAADTGERILGEG
jgi:cellulose synthase/poly-beta-1,6-N-acetylglucosamine synthase-like glycosyltransferase